MYLSGSLLPANEYLQYFSVHLGDDVRTYVPIREKKIVEKKSVPDSAISEEKLNKLITAQPVELEYKNKIYEYLVEYTDTS